MMSEQKASTFYTIQCVCNDKEANERIDVLRGEARGVRRTIQAVGANHLYPFYIVINDNMLSFRSSSSSLFVIVFVVCVACDGDGDGVRYRYCE